MGVGGSVMSKPAACLNRQHLGAREQGEAEMWSLIRTYCLSATFVPGTMLYLGTKWWTMRGLPDPKCFSITSWSIEPGRRTGLGKESKEPPEEVLHLQRSPKPQTQEGSQRSELDSMCLASGDLPTLGPLLTRTYCLDLTLTNQPPYWIPI